MRGFRILSTVTVVLTYVLMVLGAYVKAIGAGLSCPTWPSCFDDRPGLEAWAPHEIWPWYWGDFVARQIAAEWWHRFLAGWIVGPLILAVVYLAWTKYRHHKGIVWASTASTVLLPIQIGMGAVTVTSFLKPAAVVAHQGLAILVFTGLLATALFAWVAPVQPRAPRGGAASLVSLAAVEVALGSGKNGLGLAGLLKSYTTLLKPGILTLLILTGFAGIVIAPGWTNLSWLTIAITLVGGTLTAGSANIWNMIFDRDIDERMVRTSRRPIPAGDIGVAHATVLALVLGLGGAAMLWYWVNPLSSMMALGGLLFYVLVYTLYLKRRTPQNITIGGAAGGFPALVGWAAVTNSVAFAPVLLGLLVVLWTPPHFWALALVYAKDYARAEVPMMPVVRGEHETKKQMLIYTVLLLASSLAFVWPLGVLGIPYLALAIALGAPFLWYAWIVYRGATKKQTYRLFSYSIVYLCFLFLAMVADRLIAW